MRPCRAALAQPSISDTEILLENTPMLQEKPISFERCEVFVGGVRLGVWGVVLVVCVSVGVGAVVRCWCVCVCVCDLLILLHDQRRAHL